MSSEHPVWGSYLLSWSTLQLGVDKSSPTATLYRPWWTFQIPLFISTQERRRRIKSHAPSRVMILLLSQVHSMKSQGNVCFFQGGLETVDHAEPLWSQRNRWGTSTWRIGLAQRRRWWGTRTPSHRKAPTLGQRRERKGSASTGPRVKWRFFTLFSSNAWLPCD